MNTIRFASLAALCGTVLLTGCVAPGVYYGHAGGVAPAYSDPYYYNSVPVYQDRYYDSAPVYRDPYYGSGYAYPPAVIVQPPVYLPPPIYVAPPPIVVDRPGSHPHRPGPPPPHLRPEPRPPAAARAPVKPSRSAAGHGSGARPNYGNRRPFDGGAHPVRPPQETGENSGP